MVVWTRKRALIVGLAVALAPMCLLGACSNDDDGAPAPQAPHPACPANLASAIGAKCANDGLACPIGYDCAPFLPEQAHCTCTGGVFACTDSRGTVLADGVTPACVSRGGAATKECPADEATAQGASCKTTGLQCAYAGVTCPGDKAAQTDTCICEPVGGTVDAAPSLRFQCEARGCSPQSDGGTTPPRDAKADAPDAG